MASWVSTMQQKGYWTMVCTCSISFRPMRNLTVTNTNLPSLAAKHPLGPAAQSRIKPIYSKFSTWSLIFMRPIMIRKRSLSRNHSPISHTYSSRLMIARLRITFILSRRHSTNVMPFSSQLTNYQSTDRPCTIRPSIQAKYSIFQEESAQTLRANTLEKRQIVWSIFLSNKIISRKWGDCHGKG